MKKLDGTLKIPFVLDNILNFGNIEEEILSQKIEKLDTTRIYLFRRKLFLIKRLLKQI